MELIEIAAASEVPLGRARAYDVAGRTIALYHTSGGYFATDNVCPHRGGPLAQGDLIGNEINCPWHLWGFDVATGLCTGNASVSVPTYSVVIENERVFVRIE